MTLKHACVFALLVGALLPLPTIRAAVRSQQPQTRQVFLSQHCLVCHSTATRSGGLVLQGVDLSTPAANPELWEKVTRKIRSGEMPPAGRPRPDAAEATAFTGALIRDLDEAAEREPYAGRLVIRRLNRSEYSNAIRDLLMIDMPFADELPADGLANGFDNIGDALSMSPVLLERYMKLGRRISQLAVGSSDPSPVTESYPVSRAQTAWQGEDMPFGTRGGISVRHYFPYDAEYNLRAFLESDGGQMSPIEGVRFFQTRVTLKAGLHTFVATFPEEFAQQEGPTPNLTGLGGPALGGPVDAMGSAIRPTIEFLLDGRRVKLFEIRGPTPGEAATSAAGPPVLEKAEIAGPYNVSGRAETPSRQRIFVCRPTRTADESACASKILSTVARRAYRRDVTPEDMRPLLAVYKETRTTSSFDESIAAALRDVLVSPDFLFRLEIDPRGAPPHTTRPVQDFELATRLSFFLWNSIPDDELLNVARTGKLKDLVVLERQVSRMLADRRAETLVDNFAAQWLGLRAVADAMPDLAVYPEWDKSLGEAFQEETRLFIRSIIRENRNALELLDADYTFLNERLAKVYGIPGVRGPGFRRVSLAGHKERGGILGQGSVLLMTSHTNKTSPVLRGNWILTNLLNAPPPPPPAGVPPLDESAVNGKELTTRQQVERHRANPTCASCHVRMDPLGFALENFDVIGRWRTSDAGGEIDPSGMLPSGEKLDGAAGLRRLLLSHSGEFVGATVQRLMTYALGRELDARDQPTVRKILRNAEVGRYKFLDLIMGIVKSAPFRMRQTQEPS